MEATLMSASEAAKAMRLKESTIRSWILKRRIPYVKLGRRVFIRAVDIDRIINAVVPALPSEQPQAA